MNIKRKLLSMGVVSLFLITIISSISMADEASGSSSSITITMNSDTDVTAVFVKNNQDFLFTHEQINKEIVNIELKNAKSTSISNIDWGIKIKGGVLDNVEIINGCNISKLDPDESIILDSGKLSFGFGLVKIYLEVVVLNDKTYSEDYIGLMLGKNIIILG